MSAPIAIVGLSAEFPSDSEHNLDYQQYWPFLLDRRDACETPIPEDRFNHEAFSTLITPKTGAFLANPTLFDPLEFGIPPADAAALPLATRKLIEHSFLALRDAGINYRGADVGVYAAGVGHDASVLGEADPYALTGTFASIPATIANRVSYHLDLHGPSLPLDTACSSTLTATHLAVQALRGGECETAIVGGAQINLRGEGVACIVLKPLDKALRDGDHVYATILGSAINSTGNQAPLNAPVATAQQAAMERAYERAGRDPREVDFVEMHATGTAAGDPTEANWVCDKFGHKDGSPLLAGSVKGNLGHTEITAFLASLLKVTHILEHNIIPPTANFNLPNRKIHWEDANLHVPTTPTPFTPRNSSNKALVSLSSFGIGGANGHVIVEGMAPSRKSLSAPSKSVKADPTDAFLIMSGGLSPRSAATMSDLLKDTFLNAPIEHLPFLAKLAGRQARQLTWRSYALYHPHVSGPKAITFQEPQLAPRTRPPLAFVFSGQGPQHALMGRQLFAKYAAFRKSVYECDEAYREIMGFSLIESSGLFLRIPVPVHSFLMDVCKEECERGVGEVFAKFEGQGYDFKPTRTMYSTVYGGRFEDAFNVDYYWRNARQAVLFTQVTTQLVEEYPNMCYIEISPHPVLSSYVSSAGVDSSRITCPSLRPTKTGEFREASAFLESLGRLTMNGFDVDWDALNGRPAWESGVKLPAYPFSKKDIPFHSETPSFHRLLTARNGPLNHPRLRINSKTHPLLAGHVVNEEPIMPAAGFIEMALEFGGRVLSDVEFLSALTLGGEVPSTVEVSLDGARWSVRTSSALNSSGGDRSWGSPTFDRLHSRGLLTFDTDNTDDLPLDIPSITSRCPNTPSISSLYTHGFAGFASYTPDFKRILSVVQGQDELFATLRGSIGLPEADRYRFDPREHYYLPSRAARVVVHDALARASVPGTICAHFVLKEWTPGEFPPFLFPLSPL
ncbi:hypothetical protein M422DRAFT_230841 [Sphaerobolus stellatus SS14]|uniref:Polyketide synthase n=1 Tax=Sphaerobolus stellatus (strain SS14) TaxID=990650 RepID=A0A0C9U7P4_SPHS4|nr:hypothetical protein M422DRAFT_230841 [Sphaerobolus stellatus SS14]